MFNVSEEYKTAAAAPVQRQRLSGTIGSVEFSDDNILKGSLQTSEQCGDSQGMLIGSVFVGELSATFCGLELEKSTLKKQEIRFDTFLTLADGTEEAVPSKSYIIDSATWSASGVTVKAYDYMSKLDKSWTTKYTSGTFYNLLKAAVDKAGLELAQSEQEIKSWPNASGNYSLYIDNDVSTCRDLVFYLAQIVGRFCAITRDNKLELRSYSQEATTRIDKDHRLKGATFSDFETEIVGVSLTDMQSHKTIIVSGTGIGTVYNVGSNPLLQYMSEEQKRAILQNIFNSLKMASYTPAKIKVRDCPAYEVGDVIEGVNGLGEGTKTCAMNIVWRYNQDTAMQCYGKDPALSTARSKVEKNLSGILSEVDGKSIQYYTFTNADDISIPSGGNATIIHIKIAGVSNTMAIFQAQIMATGQADLQFSYHINDEPEPFMPYFSNGPIDTTTLMYPFKVESNQTIDFEVLVNSYGETLNISAGDIVAVIYGQGLAASEEWDGEIKIAESLPRFRFQSMTLMSMTDAVDIPEKRLSDGNWEDAEALTWDGAADYIWG